MTRARELARLGRGDALFVSTADKVGIGSTSPKTKLDVVGLVSATQYAATQRYTVGTGASIHQPSTNTITLGTQNLDRIRIDSDGNLGVGNNSPDVKLTVGAVGASGTSLFIHGDTRCVGVLTATSFDAGGSGSAIAGVHTTGFSTFSTVKVAGVSTFVGLVTCSDVVSSGIVTADSFYGSAANLIGISSATAVPGINTASHSVLSTLNVSGIATAATVSGTDYSGNFILDSYLFN